MYNVELSDAPFGLEEEFNALLTPDAIHFLAQLTSTFNNKVDKILWNRAARKVELDLTNSYPNFPLDTAHIRNDTKWRVAAVPRRLQNRHVDIGDTAPYQTERFHRALMSSAEGIQVDFDDGNCPTFYNQIKGIFNVCQVVHNKIPGLPPVSEAPVLMLRPRAWNMVEHNMLINGRELPGPLFDFGLLMYHTGRRLHESECGPFFYLSKVESFLEARLWNQIFVWTEEKLSLPLGSIKATVLIESVLASFEMEEILYELKDHSAGLNCGIWDYSASFVSKFGHRTDFLLPDRSKYVNMEKHFLKSYMDLLVKTCHRRGALATGGMAALLLPKDKDSAEYQSVTAAVTRLKLFEIKAGVDGFMVYDIDLVAPMQKLFQEHTSGPNQLHVIPSVNITQSDLLIMPAGGVTLFGLKYNIAVGILFIDAWLKGEGHFFYCGKVEDSATAEISRSQVWQWIRHQVKLEDDNRMVTRGLVRALLQQVVCQLVHESQLSDLHEERLQTAAELFIEIVLKRDFPEFITTYLNLDHTFLSSKFQVRS
ncbi:malate synthase-like isoform X2 [Hyla sarda]|nr:malate synthase-like isoform X2 [Hyla sarda]XP_056419119.1 malate synthase-like isoform X2 [Hyla sarda]XP_056419125.1 malate synthase-like isoform X2 [Hyla sarda]XP_056419133.1 malate synthase-like isoform X2 [Hyla sarda]XP_056419135.1 malate synthase-like isoform X2 [Hyla sarda]XP_056419141.1 malate synthase-like isoform X2 [Hyla sarda]